MAANPPKPWKAEYAKSARSSCKTCKNIIAKEVFRLGKMVVATQFDGFMPQAKQINSVDDVEGKSLRWEDQQRIRNYVNNAEPETANTAIDTLPAMGYAIEVSQTSCATCKHCSQNIMKGEVRISSKPNGQGSSGLVWNHASCFSKLSPATQVEKLPGWESLSSSDQATVVVLFSGKGTEVSDDNQPKSTSKAGTKLKMDVGNDQRSKVTKLEGNVPTDRAGSAKNIIDLTVEGNVPTDRAGSAKNIIDLTVEGNEPTDRAGSAKNIIDLTVEGNVPTDRDW
ncbi:Zinc finger, PARP-type [Corchorus olitorius]|uniref:Zinc finger, PARP-type n=1 Tax=Corchorus olitorius TaxID=93759 RepID=A0A1R3KQE8_9ROSI|nr:Zinc finger, PARP-type [Corchorus olitorius]